MMNGKDMTMVNRIDEHSTDEQIPTAAAVYRLVTGKEPLSPALQADKSTAERSWAEIAALAAEESGMSYGLPAVGSFAGIIASGARYMLGTDRVWRKIGG